MTKMISTKYGDVPQELFDKIPSLRENVEMLAAGEKLNGLRADLQALHENIQNYSTEDDAQALLDGDSLKETKGISKQEMLRKREALEMAIHLQTEEIQKLEYRLIREGLNDLEPLAKKYAKECIDTLAAAEKALRAQSELFAVLSARGYKQNLRPRKFQTMPLEKLLLHGGAFPRLVLYLQKQRELWGFKAVGKHIKVFI